jgi:hypothetical protein
MEFSPVLSTFLKESSSNFEILPIALRREVLLGILNVQILFVIF